MEYVTDKKIKKLITQVKAQKILNPDLKCDGIIEKLEKFSSGKMKKKIGLLQFEIIRDDTSFYIYKKFNNTYPYTTMRYYSLSKDDNYDKYKKVRYN